MSFMQFVKNNGNRPKVIQQVDIKLKKCGSKNGSQYILR